MKVDVYASHTHVSEKDLRGKVCVVIDTLRASSVMVTALYNGCDQIIPVEEVEQAMELKASMGSAQIVVLGGERSAEKLGGFDFGNSPLEYTEKAVSGKTVVLTTSNGTQAIYKTREAATVYIGSLLNATTVAKALVAGKADAVLLCAGTNGRFSLDDCITAGYIINRINKFKGKQTLELDDLGLVCNEMYAHHKQDIGQFVSNAAHYSLLCGLGFEPDIEYCLMPDTIDLLPRYEDGRISL